MGLGGLALSGLGGIVPGVVAPAQPGGSLLLDQYSSAFAAYSLKRIRASYTGAAVRVRRNNDNAEQDIGFNGSNGLDTAALLSFVGSNSGFVTIIYDQSGNARNLIQATTTVQPRIVNAGVIDLLSSGSPAILFNQNPWMRWIGVLSVENSSFISFQVDQYINNGGVMALIPPVGSNDWASMRGGAFSTRSNPNPVGFQVIFAAGSSNPAEQNITNGIGFSRNQIAIFRHALAQSFYWQGVYGADDIYSSGAGNAEGIGVGARWEPTGAGFTPVSGNRGNFRLESLIFYASNQRSNAAAITALM